MWNILFVYKLDIIVKWRIEIRFFSYWDVIRRVSVGWAVNALSVYKYINNDENIFYI